MYHVIVEKVYDFTAYKPEMLCNTKAATHNAAMQIAALIMRCNSDCEEKEDMDSFEYRVTVRSDDGSTNETTRFAPNLSMKE